MGLKGLKKTLDDAGYSELSDKFEQAGITKLNVAIMRTGGILGNTTPLLEEFGIDDPIEREKIMSLLRKQANTEGGIKLFIVLGSGLLFVFFLFRLL